MIRLDEMERAIAELIYEKTGAVASCGKGHTKTLPQYVVALTEGEYKVIDTGKQAERSLSLIIDCHEEGDRLYCLLTQSLLPYFTVCGRSFVPTAIKFAKKNEIMSLECRINFCDVLGKEEQSHKLMGDFSIDIYNK